MATVSSRMEEIREKSRKRKELLQKTLGINNLSEALGDETNSVNKKPKPVESKRESESSEDGAKEKIKHEEFRDSTAFLKGTLSLFFKILIFLILIK